MSYTQEIQILLDLYAERKNAQCGAISYSMLRVTEQKSKKLLIDIQGTHNEKPFEDWQIAQAANQIFFPLETITTSSITSIEGTHSQIIDALSETVDRVVLYPQTEHLQKILQKFGIDYPENNPAAILAYPIQGHPLNQFRKCDMRGFHVFDPKLIDTSTPTQGVRVLIPYSQYDNESVADAAKSVLILSKAGFSLPFSASAMDILEREVATNKSRHMRYFPQMMIPADGKVGFNSLSGYTTGTLCFVIMEEPDIVAARLAMLASKLDSTTHSSLNQALTLE